MSQRTDTARGAGAWDDMLKAALLPNQAVRIVREESDGGLTLAVPTRKPPLLRGLLSWLVRVPKERLTILDPLGAGIWRACNGHLTVEDLVVRVARHYRLSFHESRVAVTEYVSSLLKRSLLAVDVSPSEA